MPGGDPATLGPAVCLKQHKRTRSFPTDSANWKGQHIFAHGERNPDGRRHLRPKNATLRRLEGYHSDVVDNIIPNFCLGINGCDASLEFLIPVSVHSEPGVLAD